jgi:iron-sulfur cluster assembly accessory protein
MIEITKKAQEYMTTIATGDNEIVKLALEGGGCSGFQYSWNIIDKDGIDEMSDEVMTFEDGGGLIIDGMSLMYLFGSEISLESNLMGTKLIISNPQVTSSCGCGDSVNIDTGAASCPKEEPAAYNADMFYDPSE